MFIFVMVYDMIVMQVVIVYYCYSLWLLGFVAAMVYCCYGLVLLWFADIIVYGCYGV